MSHKNFIFLGSATLALKGLEQIEQQKELKLKGIITQAEKAGGRGLKTKPSPLQKKAQALCVPALTPENLKDQDFLQQVKALKAEWALVFCYGKILPPKFLSLFPKKALNFHASLLPRWRGASPIQRALMAGEQTLGMSLQVMEQHLDKGPLIGTYPLHVPHTKDARWVFDQVPNMIKALMPKLLLYTKGQTTPTPQDDTKATYAPKIDKKECPIVWDQPAQTIQNQIRALSAGPHAYTLRNGKRLKIYSCLLSSPLTLKTKTHLGFFNSPGSSHKSQGDSNKSDSLQQPPPPGTIFSALGGKELVVACKKSYLSLLEVQPESKKIMSATDYLKGYARNTGKNSATHYLR